MPFQKRKTATNIARHAQATEYDLAVLLQGYKGFAEVKTPGGELLLVECGNSIDSIRPSPWGVRPIVNAQELATIMSGTTSQSQSTVASPTSGATQIRRTRGRRTRNVMPTQAAG